MHTKDRLAAALTEAGLHVMAAKAADGYYDDFLSPLPMPIMELASDLHSAGTARASALRKRVLSGDFDATREESETWAKIPDGQEVFGKLFKRGVR